MQCTHTPKAQKAVANSEILYMRFNLQTSTCQQYLHALLVTQVLSNYSQQQPIPFQHTIRLMPIKMYLIKSKTPVTFLWRRSLSVSILSRDVIFSTMMSSAFLANFSTIQSMNKLCYNPITNPKYLLKDSHANYITLNQLLHSIIPKHNI